MVSESPLATVKRRTALPPSITSPGAPEPSIVMLVPLPPLMKYAVGPYSAAAELTSLAVSWIVELSAKPLKVILAAWSLAVTAAAIS